MVRPAGQRRLPAKQSIVDILPGDSCCQAAMSCRENVPCCIHVAVVYVLLAFLVLTSLALATSPTKVAALFFKSCVLSCICCFVGWRLSRAVSTLACLSLMRRRKVLVQSMLCIIIGLINQYKRIYGPPT